MDNETTFKPNDEARAVFRNMSDAACDALMDRFFDLWMAEGEPRRAGSMAAHAYIRNAARIAVFGARCAGHEPQIEAWLGTCEEQFRIAVIDVAEAFAQGAAEESSFASEERSR